MWKFLVKNQSIEILEREVLADHQIQYVQFKFTFDGDWKKFHKVVQFSQCDEVYSIVLGFDGTSCYLPAELHVGAVKMSVFGYDAASDTTVRATTVPVTLNIRESGFIGDDDTPIPPTPDLYTQLLQNPKIKIFALETAVSRFSDVMWVMQQILFMSMDKRLAIFFSDESARTSSDTITLTHEQIARYIGSAREVVSRMLKYFASEGIVEVSRKGIKILDKKRLRQLTL